MNVTSIGQGSGSVVTLPSPQNTGAPPVQRGPSDTVARLAWFDVNGDGHIDNRSPIAGGDGTLIVPEHAAHALYSREVHREPMRPDHAPPSETDHAQARSDSADTHPAVAPSEVQTRVAVDAYQRYGQPSDNNPPAERAVA